MAPKITIITPCFNSEKTIAQTIESVMNQSYTNLEYIIIDGKSTDRTVEIIKHYEQIFNGQLRYISEPDTGIYNAMNKGIVMADGELIGIINSDDWYESDALKAVVEAYNQHGPAVYHGMLRFFQNEKETAILMTHYQFLAQRMIQHPTCFLPKAYYEQYGLFDEQYSSSADYEFLLRLKQANVPFQQIHKVIANFREGGVSASNKGRMETYKIKKFYRILTPKTFYGLILKSKIADAFQRLIT